ncbi:MoxR family ATPase [Helcobacillus massiliensis]|uniref:AAA family ATPase n=1 Tax=Helcobacillus massiliensis TaxID=521392 RepID=UPI0021A35B33|nr:MoxR family ATPase [Helcobacillus massiliensis]MCT1557643.1 MoxR family ATPase [Helcobacillus massiliensis]MCT2035915.1 MoxR family ATPase [Helcobacillus massiliensis]MCT2331815.1 MoxR family ATPase [Helcobacillus massiliensis]
MDTADHAPLSEADAAWVHTLTTDLTGEVEKVIEGKHAAVRSIIHCLLAAGHVLIEDVPGVGKTMLARALATALDATAQRLQFTPDLLPGDITGASIFNQATRDFEFRPGAVFTHILLADEINRASAKTQSALLEAMEEHAVTVDGTTHRLDDPFMVMATANPVEMAGTFDLPEAQRDRFLMRLPLGYPDPGSELRMLRTQTTSGPRADSPLQRVRPIATTTDIARALALVCRAHTSEALLGYVVALADATRRHSEIIMGASPRAAVHLVRAAKATAACDGRTYVTPQDVRANLTEVWAHRLHLAPSGTVDHARAADILADITGTVPVAGTHAGSASVGAPVERAAAAGRGASAPEC